jgi:hypothetical protein
MMIHEPAAVNMHSAARRGAAERAVHHNAVLIDAVDDLIVVTAGNGQRRHESEHNRKAFTFDVQGPSPGAHRPSNKILTACSRRAYPGDMSHSLPDGYNYVKKNRRLSLLLISQKKLLLINRHLF